MNSHIIPKFLTYDLYKEGNHKHNLEVRVDSEKTRKNQDTPKEDNILCTSCEQRFSVVETHFAKEISKLYNFEAHPSDFTFFNFRGTQLIECKKFQPILFKLFIYSIIWRCSISTKDVFMSFNLTQQAEENTRKFLDSNLFAKKSDLIDNLTKCEVTPEYDLCIIKSKNPDRISGQALAAYSHESGAEHIISLLSFFILLYEDETRTPVTLLRITNKQNKMVMIGTGEQGNWEALLSLQINKFNLKRVNTLNQQGSRKY